MKKIFHIWIFFLSSFNYKIILCTKLLSEVKSYYYNIGFYIGNAILVLCLIEMIIFIECGIMTIKTAILNGIPNIYKLKNKLKNRIKNQNELKLNKLKEMKEKQRKNTKKESIQNINYFNFIYINQGQSNNPPKKNNNPNHKSKINEKEDKNKKI